MTEGDGTQRPTNLVDLMAELIPPPEPAPISLMPQTLGWPILIALLAVLTFLVLRRVMRARQAEAYRKTALAALGTSGSDPEKVALILRQTALTAFPRKDVASLHGQDWLAFLDATSEQPSFQGPDGNALITLPYSDASSLPDATVALVRHWILYHNRTSAP